MSRDPAGVLVDIVEQIAPAGGSSGMIGRGGTAALPRWDQSSTSPAAPRRQ